MKHLIVLALMLLAACGGGSSRYSAPPGPSAGPTAPTSWEIGPVIDGKNYSANAPLHPVAVADGLAIDIPQAPGSIHYVTMRYGPLAGRSRMILRYRMETGPGVKVVPTKAPQLPSIITLYFQRRGDDWSAQGKFEAYRWFAKFANRMPVEAGEYELIAPLDGNWTAVLTSSATNNPQAFRDALADTDRIGFVLGGGDGLGHGVSATGAARLVIESFTVE